MTIMTDILLSIKEPKILTHIMYATQLSYIQLKKHIEMLINMGLAVDVKSRDNQRFFKLTETGKIFIVTITKDGNSSEQYQEGLGVK